MKCLSSSLPHLLAFFGHLILFPPPLNLKKKVFLGKRFRKFRTCFLIEIWSLDVSLLVKQYKKHQEKKGYQLEFSRMSSYKNISASSLALLIVVNKLNRFRKGRRINRIFVRNKKTMIITDDKKEQPNILSEFFFSIGRAAPFSPRLNFPC